LAEEVLKKTPKDQEPEKLKSPPYGFGQRTFFVWFTQTKIQPAEHKYSLHIKKDMWPNPLIDFALPFGVLVNATQERYARDYPGFIEMIKSEEYEKKFSQNGKRSCCSFLKSQLRKRKERFSRRNP